MTLRVFLVEDSVVIRENLVGALEELLPVTVVGFAAAESTAIAWALANPDGCDLYVIDIFLTNGSGLGVLRSLADKQVQRVVLSNYATSEMRRQCLAYGADRVFDKSSEIDQFLRYCGSLSNRL